MTASRPTTDRPTTDRIAAGLLTPHAHMFLGAGYARNERRVWNVVALCAVTTAVEIAGGWVSGSLALVADGLHMSTHAGALLLAALAYRFARRHAADPRFCFGTGKLGDLAGFTSAVVLAAIAFGIGVEAVVRLLHPLPTRIGEALPIAVLGLAVNVLSAILLSGRHDHDHDHSRGNDHDHAHTHGAAHGADNNMRAAALHVLADAAVSALVIAGLGLLAVTGWQRIDPIVSLAGAAAIASWAATLIRDTGAVLLDMAPDRALERDIRDAVTSAGDELTDLHVWRLGPGHLGAVLSVVTRHAHDPLFYRKRLASVGTLSHVTVEVQRVE